MTIEQVKEHFKNAKEVRCLCDGQIYDISKSGIFNKNLVGIYYNLADEQNGLNVVTLKTDFNIAEIISYKEEEIPEMPIGRVMEVSSCRNKWCKRVVFGKKDDLFIAWKDAETIEDAKWTRSTSVWKYAREIKEKVVVTKKEIAQWKECGVNDLEIKD